MWGLAYYTYYTYYTYYVRNYCSDFDHSFSDEPQFFVYRSDATTHCHSQRSKRR